MDNVDLILEEINKTSKELLTYAKCVPTNDEFNKALKLSTKLHDLTNQLHQHIGIVFSNMIFKNK